MANRMPQPWRTIVDWVVTIVLAVVFVLAFEAEVAKPYRIPSSSMEPNPALRAKQGKAQLANTRQQAETIQVTAKANAERARLEGEGEASRIKQVGLADAEKIRAIGLAQAEATDKQVQAYGGPQYQLNSTVLLRFAEAIENGKLALVPNVIVGASNNGSAGGMIEMLMAMLVAEKVEKTKP